MLNPFPDLLWLGVFAPLLIRASVGAFLIFSSLNRLHRRKRLFEENFAARWPLSGKKILLAFAFFEMVLGIALFVGIFTQIGALLVLLYTFAALYKQNRNLFGYDVVTYALIFIMSLSLILTGAGPIAFDIPL